LSSLPSLSLPKIPLSLPKMDFLFFRELAVPNLEDEGELLVDVVPDSDDGNACWPFLAGVVGTLGVGVVRGVEGEAARAAFGAEAPLGAGSGAPVADTVASGTATDGLGAGSAAGLPEGSEDAMPLLSD
jgi:hypothetical protein